MTSVYDSALKAHLTIDEQGRIRHILQTEYFLSEMGNARLSAEDFLRNRAETFGIPLAQLERLHLEVSFLDPHPQAIEYRRYAIKKSFASNTYCYYQTIHNVPVWQAGMSVTVKENPFRILHADNYAHDALEVALPSEGLLERVRAELIRINTRAAALCTGSTGSNRAQRRRLVKLKKVSVGPVREDEPRRPWVQARSWIDSARSTRGSFYVYRYSAGERIPRNAYDLLSTSDKRAEAEVGAMEPVLPLPPVPHEIRDGQHYLVAEIVFNLRAKRHLNWRALVEVKTGSILWLRALISGVQGLVFAYDPQTSEGDLSLTPDDGNVVLNPLRDDVALNNLDPSLEGKQFLTGSNVKVVDEDEPEVVPPIPLVGTDFDYDSRSNDFAAVNAYYHGNEVFETIENLGFVLEDYFDGTACPVALDHRASLWNSAGIERGAFCAGNATSDGIGLVGYMLSDLTNTDNPLGRAVDKWVHWHEIAGHGILWDHVGFGYFGFAHSAGDSLAAFQNDPVSRLRNLPERFQYSPFRGLDRWFNRAVADGWGWGGAQDTGSYEYKSEQILATTLFRLYRALGGDADNEKKRWQASRVATYLVLNAVGQLFPGGNPATVEDFYNRLEVSDADDWTSEGYAGGAYGKVIRWAFEKQGLFRAAGESSTAIGAPPSVDLYIDDGRAGEYQYQAVHWNCPSVWARAAPDGGTTPEPGVAGVTSFAYVRVKNRGTSDATGTVKVYHCLPGAGLTWPTDFVQAGPPAGLSTGNMQASNGNESIVGPFEWIPNKNAYGHDCLLAIVHADGDPSNVDKLEVGQTIEEWRLVPHDNNVGQRNVVLVSGDSDSLVRDLDGAVFVVRNSFNKPSDMELRVEVPKELKDRGWKVEPYGMVENRLRLKAGENREMKLRVRKGSDFDAEGMNAAADRDFRVSLFGNGVLLGGMTYRIDVSLERLTGGGRKNG